MPCRATLLLLLALWSTASSQQEVVPRGVPLSRAERFRDGGGGGGGGGAFVCDGGQRQITLSAINDDYCDCRDGTDEPGTSACNGGWFYCRNAGFRGRFVPSSFVGDAVCDCCDASDEPAERGCPNTCAAAADAAREAAAQRISTAEAGARAKQEYSHRGREARALVRARLEQKQAAAREMANRTAWLQEREQALEADAGREQRCNVTGGAAGRTGPWSRLGRILGGSGVRWWGLGGAGPHADGDDGASVGASALGVLEATNRAGPEPGSEPGSAFPPAPEDEVEETNAQRVGMEEEENKKTKEGGEVCENPVWRATHDALADARDEERALLRDVKELQAELDQDFGPDLEFWALKGRCFELTHWQWTYEMCPFGKASQKEGGSKQGTLLGSWSELRVREAHPLMTTFHFDGGDRCWNGPVRSLTVQLQCGSTDELTEVDEPSTCEYEMKFSTPAACSLRDIQPLDLDLGGPEVEFEPAGGSL